MVLEVQPIHDFIGSFDAGRVVFGDQDGTYRQTRLGLGVTPISLGGFFGP
jgi:hypothetical protein